MILRNSFRPWQAALLVAAAGSVFALAGCPASTTDNNASTTGSTTGSTMSTNSSTDNSTNSTTGTKSAGIVIPGLKPIGKTDPLKLAIVTNNVSDFWTICKKGADKADADLPNTTVDFKSPPNGTAEEQQNIIKALLVTGTKGIAISPSDPKNEVTMLNETSKQALVATQDSDAPDSKRAFYVGTDNHAAGILAGKEIMKALPQGGKIILFVGKLDAQNAHDRQQGILDAIKGSNVTYVKTFTDDADRLRANSNAKAAMVTTPDVKCLVGLWSYNGPQILNAVRSAKKTGQVKIVCFDEEDDTLGGVRSGDISATIVQNPYEFGRQSIMLMDKAIRGDTSGIPTSRQLFIPLRVIDKSKVDQFQAELKKLRS